MGRPACSFLVLVNGGAGGVLLFGSSLAPFILMQPAFRMGFAAAKTPDPTNYSSCRCRRAAGASSSSGGPSSTAVRTTPAPTAYRAGSPGRLPACWDRRPTPIAAAVNRPVNSAAGSPPGWRRRACPRRAARRRGRRRPARRRPSLARRPGPLAFVAAAGRCGAVTPGRGRCPLRAAHPGPTSVGRAGGGVAPVRRAYARAARTRSPQRTEHHWRRPCVRSR